MGLKNNLVTKNDIAEYSSLKVKPILYVKNLTKKYFGRKTPAINNISFEVFPGEFHAFIGANGAGKTTTIKSIIAAYANWKGTILINGIKNYKKHAKRFIGYIPENARFPEKFSTFSYLKWMGMLSGKKQKESIKIAKKTLIDLNMWNLRHASPNTFSSGQKKKILLAQALIHDPKILIMDEPAANLDPKARGDFFRMLESLKKKNKAIFISSHILTEIDKYADSVTILDGGKVIFSGRKDELYKLFNLNTFRCDTTDNAFFKKLLKKEKINARKIKGALEFKIENYDKFHKMQTFLASKKIYFNLLEKKMPTLQDIYDKLVKKGSVDTAKKK